MIDASAQASRSIVPASQAVVYSPSSSRQNDSLVDSFSRGVSALREDIGEGKVSIPASSVLGSFASAVADAFSSTLATITTLFATNLTSTNATSTNFVSLTAPVAPYYIATSTTATSTFAGALGIGTSSPTSRLSVDGDAYVSGVISSGNLVMTRGSLGLGYATGTAISDGTHIATWGDSLTHGDGAALGAYQTALVSLIGGYDILNGGVGGENSTQIKNRMLAAPETHAYPTIIWSGRNNFTSPVTVKADIAEMVSALAAVGNENYLILSVLNASGESVGTSNYNAITQLNEDLSDIYGSHYVDVRSYLVSLYDSGQPQDVIDHDDDIPPSSLRFDTVHLTLPGYQAVAQKISQNIDVLQGTTGRVLTTGNIATLFGSSTAIGVINRNVGYFSTVGIGTSSPSSKLEVSDSGTNQSQLTLSSLAGASAVTGIDFKTPYSGTANTGHIFSSFYGGSFNGYTVTGMNFVSPRDAAGFGFKFDSNNGTTRMFIDSSSGRIGIGTTSPQGQLEVSQALTNASQVRITSLSGANAVASISLNTPLSGTNYIGGIHSSYYGTTVSGNTVQGITFSSPRDASGFGFRFNGNSGTTRLIIDTSSGNVGIGTTSPTAQLTNTGTIRFGAFGSAGASLVTDANGNVTVSSDERLKDVTGDFTRGLGDLSALRPITYRWNATSGLDTSGLYTGFSAQNVQSAIPEAVGTDSRGYLTLSDRPILATVVNAIKELSAKVDGLISSEFTYVNKITTKELCLEDICINRQQLLELINRAGSSYTTSVVSIPVVDIVIPDINTASSSVSTTTSSEAVNDVIQAVPEDVVGDTSSTSSEALPATE